MTDMAKWMFVFSAFCMFFLLHFVHPGMKWLRQGCPEHVPPRAWECTGFVPFYWVLMIVVGIMGIIAVFELIRHVAGGWNE